MKKVLFCLLLTYSFSNFCMNPSQNSWIPEHLKNNKTFNDLLWHVFEMAEQKAEADENGQDDRTLLSNENYQKSLKTARSLYGKLQCYDEPLLYILATILFPKKRVEYAQGGVAGIKTTRERTNTVTIARKNQQQIEHLEAWTQKVNSGDQEPNFDQLYEIMICDLINHALTLYQSSKESHPGLRAKLRHLLHSPH